MNLILLTEDDFTEESENHVTISGRRFKHILSIHKVVKGDQVPVGILNGKIGTGRIETITDTFIKMELSLNCEPPPPVPVTLICALPRPRTVKKVIQCAITLGIKEFFFINSWRVEKSYWQSPVLHWESIVDNCILGLEQACDTGMPEINFRPRFRPFFEDELPSIVKKNPTYVFHPYCADSVEEIAPASPCTLVIGPEGGWNEFEIDLLQKSGCIPVSAGERILRVEYALPFILGKIV